MSVLGFAAVQKVSALVPLALISAGSTAFLAGYGGLNVADENNLPDTMVPIEALQDPANYTNPGQIGLAVKGGGADIVASASTNGIPEAALAAYQRAATVINDADKACNIDWQLIAAIGRVESDHGRYAGNTLDANGVSRPGIYGIPLNGTNNTQSISDTDAGQYDNDKVYDRAVGPMQFIPSTWGVVGVDADGDGKRNPQDIDDAALAAAVYLCSGDGDLATESGRHDAVFRYNHSEEYVDLVLAIRDAYLEGDYTAVPNYVTSAYTFTPAVDYTRGGNGGKGGGKNTGGNNNQGPGGGTDGPGTDGPGTDGPGTDGPGTDGPGTDGPGTDPVTDGGKTVTEIITGTDTDGDGDKDGGLLGQDGTVDTTVKTITKAAATTLCTAEATTKDLTTLFVKDYDKFFNECMARNGY